MGETKYDVIRGADIYRAIYQSRLKSWILKGIIKRDDALVRQSGLSGWRKPEELEELKPFFEQRENQDLRGIKEQIEPTLFPKRRVKNILIIDDEQDLCWLLSNILTIKGYNVSIANTISEGIGYLKRTPDLVFLDLKLPDGNGMNILPKIKEITPQTFVIIISAYGSGEIREEAKEKGVHGFIDKPFTEEEISRTIGQFDRKDDINYG